MCRAVRGDCHPDEHFATHYRKSDTESWVLHGEKGGADPRDRGRASRSSPRRTSWGLTIDGGLQLPHVVASACMAWLTAPTSAPPDRRQRRAAAGPRHRRAGRALRPADAGGTLLRHHDALEPHAGLSLGDVTTRAVPADDGTHRSFGSKMWISGGDHEMGDNIVHLVLDEKPARRARRVARHLASSCPVGEDGAIGERNDVVLAGINQANLGSRGTVKHRAGSAAPSRRAVPRARSVTSSASPTRACPTCST